jgi:EAL and modified HD-GYP domain-containing signal transduction protein
MKILIARQAIYDRDSRIIAYELLHRDSKNITSYVEPPDGDFATASVVTGAFYSGGIENLTGRKMGFVNFTETLLKSGIVKALPPRYAGVEVLETVEPGDGVLGALTELKRHGYRISLDDYVYDESTRKLIEYADIIKIDFKSSNDDEKRFIVREYKGSGIKFVAEKIETKEDYLKAWEYGYDYFQGFYLCAPEMMEIGETRPARAGACRAAQRLRDSRDRDKICIESLLWYGHQLQNF